MNIFTKNKKLLLITLVILFTMWGVNMVYKANKPKETGTDISYWIQETMRYYEAGDCANASASAYHVSVNIPIEDTSKEAQMARELLPFILNSDICKSGL